MSDAASTFDIEAAPVQSGRQLAAARERCGLSVTDVARQLKLSPSQVEAMEAGHYERLPGTVFARGFIRNYARLVKLDPAPLMAGAEQPLSPAGQPAQELRQSVDIPFLNRRKIRWGRYAILALVSLVALVVFDFYLDDATETTVMSRQLSLPQAAVEEKVATVTAMPQLSAEGDALAASSGTAAGMQTEKDVVEASGTPAGTASAEPKPGKHLLKLKFNRESWVEIHDRHGRRIFSQLNPAGTEQAVSGLPPLSLVVGNAAGVRLTYDERPVDLAPHIKVDVARLTLE